jgi:thioredoxin 1
MSNIREATDDNFQDLVINSEKPVIVDFWAAWCGPCRLVAPEIDKLAEKYAGSVEVVKLDVDANPHTAMHYGIMSIPTVAFFAPGQPPRAAVGFRPAEQLEAAFSLDSLTAPATEPASGDAASA